MKQQELPGLTVDVEAFIGFTAFVKTSDHKPPLIGWWKTRREDIPYSTPRRWWDGFNWSLPVDPGDKDEEVNWWKARHAPMSLQSEIEWCGLKEEHPAGYSYPLVRTVRLNALAALNRGVP